MRALVVVLKITALVNYLGTTENSLLGVSSIFCVVRDLSLIGAVCVEMKSLRGKYSTCIFGCCSLAGLVICYFGLDYCFP